MRTNITLAYKRAFAALTSGEYDNFALMSCFVDEQPACAICFVQERPHNTTLWPLFVSITPTMKITDHDGVAPGENVPLSAKFAWFASPRLVR